MRIKQTALVAAVLIAVAVGPVQSGPVVVELYTSQGCNTCPPADALLGELKRREDVLPLSIHVNYWDYLGWKDPYATQIGTDRQRGYQWPLRQRYIYTPQMVFQGRSHEAGHRQRSVEAAIERARVASDLNLDLAFDETSDGRMTVSIPASDYDGTAEVMMVLYDDQHTTQIRRGENAGRTLTYHNVVREIRPIGTYDGEAITLALPTDGPSGGSQDGCAVLVQEAGLGPVIGAGSVPLPN